MTAPARHLVLLVEDEEGIRASVTRFLQGRGFDVDEADSMAGAEERFRARRPDAVILDYYMPDGDGLTLLKTLRSVDATVPVVLLTAHGSIDLAVRALKEGADHFLTKPTELPTLLVVIERLIENQRHRQASLAQKSRAARVAVDPFLGDSPLMRRLAEQARRVLASSSPVLILGETGSGKGLLAQWLHANGPRADEAFVDLNCAGLSRELLESEIFGHEKGSFTGADRQHLGFFERASGGTLFLDEITEMPLDLQVKLLRVLETGTFMRVGSTHVQETDVRIIAATNRQASQAVASGKLREDLLYRLNVFPIHMPPLRDRIDDVPMLAEHFVREISRREGQERQFTPAALERLRGYAWPGNVRELRNIVHRAYVMAPGTQIEDECLPASAEDATPAIGGAPVVTVRIGTPLAEVERQVTLATLEYYGRHKERTAATLGVSLKTLYNRLKEYSTVPAAEEMPDA